jgi:hypothetical protein
MSITGKIYCIYSDKTDKIYIGSTTKNIFGRLYQHWAKYRNGHLDTTSREILKLGGNVKVKLIEEYKCNSITELLQRESDIMFSPLYKDKIVNKCDPVGKTTQQLRDYNKQYYLTRRHLLQQYYTCTICHAQYSYFNASKHFKTHNLSKAEIKLEHILREFYDDEISDIIDKALADHS